MATTRLKVALRTYPYTEALKTGAVSVPGVALDFEEVKPHIAAFRRMVRDLAFDVCEIAPTTYMIARAYGVPIIALPVFFVRRFHHAGFVVRPESGIAGPKDLEGRNFGVRAYSVTTGVWKRGLLQNDYGVDIDKVTWWVDDVQMMELERFKICSEFLPTRSLQIRGVFGLKVVPSLTLQANIHK